MSEVIIAVDPGKVTGIARYAEASGTFVSEQLDCWPAVRQIHDSMRNDEAIFKRFGDRQIRELVCESYVITNQTLKKTRGENWSLESIGALRYLCDLYGVRFMLQTPGEGKQFGTDGKLKTLGWWHPTTGGHANDAARHLLTYLAKTNRLPAQLTGGTT